MELSIGQILQAGPIKAWRKISRLFSGIGFAMIMVSFLVSIYYNVILAWSIYYLYNSFKTDIPWVGCHHAWNTDKCYELNTTSTTNTTAVSSSKEFLTHNVLEMTNGIDEPGDVNLKLAACLFVAWVLVYFCIWKGIRTTGKVVYVTATLPYVFLVILFIRAITLPGSIDGILYYVTPVWTRLADPKVWIDAASQILYSLTIGFGVLIGFASYNRKDNDVYKDALLISLVNCGTSVFAGFVVFAVVGHMAHIQGNTPAEVASQDENSSDSQRHSDANKIRYQKYLPNSSVIVGKGFNFDSTTSNTAKEILNTQTFRSEPVIMESYASVPRVVPVTAASSNHFNESLIHIKTTIPRFFPDVKLVFFDLGLENQQVEILKNMNFVDYRKFDFARFPRHVVELYTYAWKVLIIQEMLAEFGAIMWLDASIQLVKDYRPAIEQMFGQVEVVAAAILAQYPGHLHRYREAVVLAVCLVMFVLGLSCVTQGGIYVFNLLDSFSAGISLLFLVMFELLVVGWIYGAQKFAKSIERATGRRVSMWWVTCWKIITPLMVIGILMFSVVKYQSLTYEGKQYPRWAEGLGWIIACCSMLCIPITAVRVLYKAEGSLFEAGVQFSVPFALYDSFGSFIS
ncbi:hypothetical protein ACROYT_G039661 [Oculina patagonica]